MPDKFLAILSHFW